MALALLDLVGWERGRLRLTINTGTSRYYEIKVGRSAGQREGFDWVDEVYLRTPIKSNDAGGGLLKTSKDIAIAAPRVDHGDVYVQLVSYKTPDGKSPAYSRVLKVPSAAAALVEPRLLSPLSVSTSMTAPTQPFQTPRRIACPHSPDDYAQQASIEDVLGKIVKVAAPVVLDLLGGNKSGGAGGTPTGGQAAGDSGSSAGDVLSFFLKTLLNGLGGAPAAPGGGTPTGTTTPANTAPPTGGGTAPAQPNAVKPQSLSFSTPTLSENRFSNARRTQWSRPFIFGIDDALLGALVGPALSVLPQLVNAANQARKDEKAADYKLVSDTLSDINKRLLMEQLLAAQQKTPTAGQPDLNALLQMLQQAAANQTAPVKTASLSSIAAPAAAPSNRAALSFVAADPLPFNGAPRLIFQRGHDLEFKLRFTVAEPVPKSALPKAIVTLTFKGGREHKHDDARSTQQSMGEPRRVVATLKQKNVAPNSVLTMTVTANELSVLPADRVIPVIAEIRWPSSSGDRTYSATGSAEIVLVEKYYVRERGQTIPGERELTDMSRFRAFWNKVWEAPTLSKPAAGDDDAKRRWLLDVDARYLMLISPDQTSNGLMETKLHGGTPDEQSIYARTEGKLKGGIELSLSELNKLSALWDNQAPLDGDHLAAFKSHAIARANSGELLSHLSLKGRAGERGMVWVVPVFQLVEFTLSGVQKTDDAGQVVAVADEKVRFPMPVAARVLGMKSDGGGD
jgi:hypothetical protein